VKPLDRLRPQLGPDVPYEQLSRAQKQARRAAAESKVRPYPVARLLAGAMGYRYKDIHASPKRALRTLFRLNVEAERSNERRKFLRKAKTRVYEVRG
jgi:hypothetical protein